VPDPEWGERAIAVVVPKPDIDISEMDVIDFVGEKLASFKKPKAVYFVDELPYSPSGKMLKRLLREKYSDEMKHE
jgi:acyl-CoA synthetase (AMP-forming)/AMP-acid ligase II